MNDQELLDYADRSPTPAMPPDEALLKYADQSPTPPQTEVDLRRMIQGSMEPKGFWQTYAEGTIPGLIGRGINRAIVGKDYVEQTPGDFGTYGNAAVGALSMIADPTNLLLAGGAKAAGEAAISTFGKGVVGRAIGEKVLPAAIVKGTEAAAFMAQHTAVSDPLQQYIATGKVNTAQTAERVAKSALVGFALGPAASIAKPIPRIAGEIGTFTLAQPASEGRLPTAEDFIGAATAVLGFNAAGKVLELSKRLKKSPGADPLKLAEEVLGKDNADKVLSTLMTDSTTPPSGVAPPAKPKTFDTSGTMTPEEQAAFIEQQGGESTPPTETQNAQGPVSDVRSAQGNGPEQAVGGQNNELNGPPGAPVPPPEAQRQAQGGEGQGPPVLIPGESGRQTSLKNAVVDEERAARGLSPVEKALKVSNPEAWAKAEKALTENPNAGAELVDSFVLNPRSMETADQALLLRHKTDLRNRHDRTLSELTDAKIVGDVEKTAELEVQDASLSEKLNEIDEVSTAAGTAWGSAGQFRQLMSSEDYSLSRAVLRKESTLGRKLTSEELADEKRFIKEGDELRAKLAASEAEVERLKSEKAVQAGLAANIKEVASPKNRSRRSKEAKAELDAAKKEFLLAVSGTTWINPAPVLLSSVKLARAYIKSGVAKFQDFYDRVKADIGEKKAANGRDVLEEAWRTAFGEAPTRPIEPGDSAEIAKFAKELGRHFVERGVRELGPFVDAIHGELEKIVPGITRGQAMDAFSDLGKFRPISKDEVDVALRDLRAQAQKTGQLREMQEGRPPPKTGFERQAPSDEERRLQQQVNEMKKRGGYVVTDPQRQLKTTLDAKKTWLTHRIADLKTEIETRTKLVKKRGVLKLDAKTQELQNEYNDLRKQRDEIFGKPELTDEQRTAIAIKAAERSAAEWERRVRDRELVAKKKGTQTKAAPELKAVRDRRDAAKAELQHLRDLANPKRTQDEIDNSRLQANALRRIADFQDRIARGDFAPRAKRTINLNPATEKIRFAEEQWRREFKRRQEKDRQSQMTFIQKTGTFIRELFNLPIELKTNPDFSMVLRQGKLAGVGHPIQGMRAVRDMLKSAKSKAGASRMAHEIESDSIMPLARRSRLPITDPEGSVSQREEMYVSSWTKHVPFFAMSKRAAIGFLNRQRIDLFKTMARNVGQSGTITASEAKVVAKFVGDLTGRADIAALNSSAWLFSKIFFGPKFVASRFRLVLSPLATVVGFNRGPGNTARVRRAIAVEYGRTLIGLGLYYSTISAGVYALLGPPGKDKKWNVELSDTNSPDWGTIRIGNMHIDPLAGIKQIVTFGSRTATSIKNLIQGKRGKGRDSVDLVLQLGRSKLAPIPGTVINVVKGKNVVGEKTTPLSVLRDLGVSLSFVDIYDALKDEGVEPKDAISLLSLLGEGVSTYQSKQQKAEAARKAMGY